MSLFAKLLTLSAIQTQDSDGTDELVMSRAGGVIFERLSLSTGEEFEFDNRLVPFDQSVGIVLTEVDRETQQHQDLGTVFIRSDDQHQVELTQQFRGSGALYDLKYKVLG